MRKKDIKTLEWFWKDSCILYNTSKEEMQKLKDIIDREKAKKEAKKPPCSNCVHYSEISGFRFVCLLGNKRCNYEAKWRKAKDEPICKEKAKWIKANAEMEEMMKKAIDLSDEFTKGFKSGFKTAIKLHK